MVIKKDFDKALDYSFDEFFQIIPKNQMVLLMKKTFENPDMEFQIEFPSLNDFEEIKVFKEKSYVKFNSYGVLKLKFKEIGRAHV